MNALKKTFDGIKIGAIIIGLIVNYGIFSNLYEVIEQSGIYWAIATLTVVFLYDLGIILHTIFTYNQIKKNEDN